MRLRNPVKHCGDRVLHFTEYGVDPLERGNLGAVPAATGDDLLMRPGLAIEHVEAGQPVADDVATRTHTAIRVGLQSGRRERWNAPQLNLQRMSFGAGLYRRDEGKFVIRTTAALPRAFSTEIRVIHFDTSGKRLAGVVFQHDLHHFVFELPRSVLANAEFAAELQRGEALLALCEEVDG